MSYGSNYGSFSGSGYITYGTSYDPIVYNKAFSIVGWFKTGVSDSNYHDIVSKNYNSSPYQGWRVVIGADGGTQGKVIVQLYSGSSQQLYSRSANSYNDNAWHFFVITYDGSLSNTNLKIYVDGTLDVGTTIPQGTLASMTNSGQLEIGGRDGANELFNGSLSNIYIYSKVLGSQEMTDLKNSGTFNPMVTSGYASGALAQYVADYYKMEGDSNDAWGTNNGTDTSLTYGTSYGKVNEGASFNGTSSKISLGTITASNTNFTFAAWINTSVFDSSGRRVISFNGDNFIIDIQASGVIQANYWNGSTYFTINASGYSTGTWYFVVYIASGNSQKLYINNTLAGSATATLPTLSSFTTNYIGSAGTSAYFQGDIDEAFIGTAISAKMLSDLYNSGTGQTVLVGTAYTRSMSDSVSRGASRSVVLSSLAAYHRTASDSVFRGASRTATLSSVHAIIRTMSDGIMNAKGRLATVVRVWAATRTMSDSVSRGASRTITIGTQANYHRTESDSVSIGAGRSITLSKTAQYFRGMSDAILNGAGRFTTLSYVKSAIMKIGSVIAGITSVNPSGTGRSQSPTGKSKNIVPRA